jgi:hypothetical protein
MELADIYMLTICDITLSLNTLLTENKNKHEKHYV